LAIEAKRVERLSIEEAFAQATRNAGPADMPCVIHRRNRQALPAARVTLTLADDNRSVEINRVQCISHCIHSSLIGLLFITTTHEPS
jgi:hypothetical protein